MASKADQTSTTSSKVFMLRAKSGFVIPKNKLSGSLVPASKANAKNGNNSAAKESSKQSQQKTKFSSRFAPDASVRKRTAFAYQVFLNAILVLVVSN
jgi:splicing factor 1